MTNSIPVIGRIVSCLVTALCLPLLGGCGLILELTSTPQQVAPGGAVELGIKVTNPSQCPFGDVDVTLLPFIPVEEILIEGDDEDLENLVAEILTAACTGGSFELPDGVECRIEDNDIVCEFPPDEGAAHSAEGVTVRSPTGTLLACERDGSRLICARPADDGEAGQAALAPMGLTCGPEMGGEINCSMPGIAPGAMATTSVSLAAPTALGTYYSMLLGGAFDRGICKNTGTPCGGDSDCPGGAMGVCGLGICIDDQTQALGVGCDSDAECPQDSSCVICEPDNGLPPLPFACAQTVVQAPTAPAPALSPWAAAAAVLVLLAVAYYRRRRAWEG